MIQCFLCLAACMGGGSMHDSASLHLSSLQNLSVKQLVKLRDRSERENTGLFLIEGYRELLRAADRAYPVKELFICPSFFLGSNEQALITQLQQRGTKVITCSEAVFSKISYRDRPDGLLGTALKRLFSLSEFDKALGLNTHPFIVIAEAIEKPGNLGTILRSSDAVGLDGLIVCDQCTDIYNPNVVRASVGTLFTVPVIEAKSAETLKWLKRRGISIVAATPHAQQEFTKVDFTGPLAIAVGTEQLGLSDLWMENASMQVKIPMCGVADSLNVAMATTLLLYEVLRQRRS